MKKEQGIFLGATAALTAIVGFLAHKGTAKAAPVAPWEPAEPPPDYLKKRFFKSYKISPKQPQEIWVYVVAPYTCQSESINPETGWRSAGGIAFYGSEPEPNRIAFDYIMDLPILSDQNARQLAELVTLFGFS